MYCTIEWSEVIQALLILGGFGILSFSLRKVLKALKQKENLPDWAKSLAAAFYTPSLWLVLGAGLLLAIDVFFTGDVTKKLRQVFFVIVGTWTLFIWKKSVEDFLKRAKKADLALIYGIGKIATVVLFTISGLFILDIFGIQPTALLAFGGIGGLALGWAGKDVVVNFFGGLMIHATRPFAVGETIRSVNKNFEGIVEEIGWYLTKLRTFARQPMYIPNALFLDAIIENSGRMYNRRILQRVGLRYLDVNKVETVTEAIVSMLKKHPEIDQRQMIIANLVNFGPSSLDIDVICFTKTISRTAWLAIQHDVLLKIANIIENHGAEIAFPTTTVHLDRSGVESSIHYQNKSL